MICRLWAYCWPHRIVEQGTEIYYYHALGLGYIPGIQIHYVKFIWVYLIFRDNVWDQVKKNTAKPIAAKIWPRCDNRTKGSFKFSDSVVNQIKITPLFFSFIDMWSYRYTLRTSTLRQIGNINRNKWKSVLFWDCCWKMVLNCLDCKCLIF